MELLLNSKQTAGLANLLDTVSAQVRLGSGYRNEAGYWATQVGPDLKADDMQRIGWLLEDVVSSAWLPEGMQQWATAWGLTIMELTSGEKAL